MVEALGRRHYDFAPIGTAQSDCRRYDFNYGVGRGSIRKTCEVQRTSECVYSVNEFAYFKDPVSSLSGFQNCVPVFLAGNLGIQNESKFRKWHVCWRLGKFSTSQLSDLSCRGLVCLVQIGILEYRIYVQYFYRPNASAGKLLQRPNSNWAVVAICTASTLRLDHVAELRDGSGAVVLMKGAVVHS